MQTLLPMNYGQREYFRKVENEVHIKKITKKKEEKKDISFEKYKDPFLSKVIKNLIQTEKELQKKILKITENEKLVKSKSYIKLFNKNPTNLMKDRDIIKSKINDLSKNKSLIISRADYINSEIFKLQNKDDVQSGDFKSKILQNINKFNQNLNQISIKVKKINNKFDKSSDNINNNNHILRLSDKYEEQNFLEEQKLKELKYMRELEREDIKKRNEKNRVEVLKALKYVNVKPKKGYYLYEKLCNDYLDHRDNLIKKENAKRKAYMRHIDGREILENERNYLERKIQMEENIKENKQSLKKEWHERQKLIPNYDNPFIKLLKEEKVKFKLEKELKLQKCIENKTNMINFSNKLRNSNKFKERIDLDSFEKKKEKNGGRKIFNQSLACKNEYSDKIRKKMMKKVEKSRENSKKNEKSRENSEIQEKQILKINNSQPKLISTKRPIFINEKNIYNNNSTDRSNRLSSNNNRIEIPDYLSEHRKKLKPELNNIFANDIKKFLIKSRGNEKSLLISKYKLEYLKEKKEQKDRFLKLNGGIAKNPEVGEELYNLSFNIIKGKLAIIEEIEKKLNKKEGKKPKYKKSKKPEVDSESESKFLLEDNFNENKESIM